jgi:ribonuclease D
VRYLDTPEAADAFLQEVAGVREVALDTEGASFHRFVDRIYLLQITTRPEGADGPDVSAIVDPLAAGPLPGLRRLVENPDVEIVFHDADYDLRLLHQDYGWHPTRLFDTRVAAQLLGIRAFGLAALLEREFGIGLDKKHQRADWSMRPLTADMLDYAAQDTRWLLDLRDRLRAQLERLGRLGWAEEEFARVAQTRWEPEDPALSYLRVKGARDLTRRELALLRELVPWRDGIARELDRATFRVATNDVLMDVARRAPQTRDELATIKGVPRGSLDARGGEILDAVRRGLAVPDAELPRFPRAARWDRDPEFDARVSRLRTVRDAAAARLDLDPGVLCSRERMETIARRAPTTVEELAEATDLRRWQLEVLGDDMLRALRNGGGTTAPSAAPAPVASTAPAPPAPPADPTDAARSPYRDG